MLYQPMSSPQITRMLGFFASWARAGTPVPIATPRKTSASARADATMAIISVPRAGGDMAPVVERGRSLGPPARSLPALLAGMALHLLHLLHDLRQVVGGGVLHRRERDVGLKLLKPQRLADGQEVPVVLVGCHRPREGAACAHQGLYLLADRGLERIALDINDLGPVIGLRAGDEASRRIADHGEVELPVLVTHRRRVRARVVEERVAGGLLRLPRQE